MKSFKRGFQFVLIIALLGAFATSLPAKHVEISDSDIENMRNKIDEELSRCPLQCPVTETMIGVEVEVVIPRVGNDPFNPYDPLSGGTAAGPLGPPPPSICTYVYSDWSACQPNNTQTRTVISSSPPDCTGTPVLTQSCAYAPPPTSCFHNGSFIGCGSGCGITGPLSISVTGSTVTASPFGDNGSQTFNVNGNTATSSNTNLTILGKPGHTCTISCSGVIHCERTNNSSIQCNEQCTYQR